MSETSILDSGVKLVRNVDRYNIGAGSLTELSAVLTQRRAAAQAAGDSEGVCFLVDSYFQNWAELSDALGCTNKDLLLFVDVEEEPKTNGIDDMLGEIQKAGFSNPAAIVGMGGGIAMDTAKAISNLLTNGGQAADYQGWDLVKRRGIFKIGIPTISGTGAEATRTCVMTNKKSGLKLGMNSDFTVFDHIIMDPELTKTVPRDQYFFTGMDAYIHCVEALAGEYRNPIGDAFSRESLALCRSVFTAEDMQSLENREKLMVASYLGGCAIATSYVGVVNPLSAGLSVVFGTHHCIANCIVMTAMQDFYPEPYAEFMQMVEQQAIAIPKGIAADCDEATYRALYDASVMHEKPLTNALGSDYKSILTFERVTELFKSM